MDVGSGTAAYAREASRGLAEMVTFKSRLEEVRRGTLWERAFQAEATKGTCKSPEEGKGRLCWRKSSDRCAGGETPRGRQQEMGLEATELQTG